MDPTLCDPIDGSPPGSSVHGTFQARATRTFNYDLNQIPYDCTVEVINRPKGLDLINRVPEELWTEVCNTVQEAVIKTIAEIKKFKKIKWLSEEALQIAEKRREVKGKGEKKNKPN